MKISMTSHYKRDRIGKVERGLQQTFLALLNNRWAIDWDMIKELARHAQRAKEAKM